MKQCKLQLNSWYEPALICIPKSFHTIFVGISSHCSPFSLLIQYSSPTVISYIESFVTIIMVFSNDVASILELAKLILI